ncbi:MAG: hypothetical protein QI223_09595 [Candidatus Korarchaeota archaeon]|nr:hypothetical protein [Candidatus Korarchaeota archaeon]
MSRRTGASTDVRWPGEPWSGGPPHESARRGGSGGRISELVLIKLDAMDELMSRLQEDEEFFLRLRRLRGDRGE